MPVYDDVTKIRLTPLDSVSIVINGPGTLEERSYTFVNPEGESTLAVDAVTSQTDTGGRRAVAYRLNGTLICPYNELGSYTLDPFVYPGIDTLIANINTYGVASVAFYLQPEGGGAQGGYGTLVIEASGVTVADWSIIGRTEQVELRHRVIFEISGLLSVDAINVIYQRSMLW